MFVLDTNTVVYFFRGHGDVPRRLLSTSPSQIAIPSIVLFELEFGIAKAQSAKKRRAQLGDLAQAVQVLPFGDSEAQAAAKLRAQLERKGTPIGPYDVLIAGTAIACGGTLVTNNTNEFSRVPSLKLDNWL